MHIYEYVSMCVYIYICLYIYMYIYIDQDFISMETTLLKSTKVSLQLVFPEFWCLNHHFWSWTKRWLFPRSPPVTTGDCRVTSSFSPVFSPLPRVIQTEPIPSPRAKPSAEASKVLQRPSKAKPRILEKPTLGLGWGDWGFQWLFMDVFMFFQMRIIVILDGVFSNSLVGFACLMGQMGFDGT